MYGTLVIAYLFLGGAAAGGFFMMAAWSLFFRRSDRTYRHVRAFESLRARMYTICLIMLALALLMLLWDLEYPHKALLVFLRPHATAITFGAYSLIALGLLGALLVLGALFRFRLGAGWISRALEALCCVLSLAVMGYTGIFLASNPAVAFWNTGWLVVLFVCSSLSCGLSLLLLVDYFIKDQTLLLRAVRPLQGFHLACLAAEAASLVLFANASFNNPDAGNAWALLLSPDMLSTALVGIVGFGIVIPAALETYAITRKECRTIPVSDALCLCGGLCLRYCAIACGIQ